MLAVMSDTSTDLRSQTATRGLLPAAAGLLAMLLAFSPKVLNDGDTWWHIAAGRMMIAQHAVLRTDPFSSTFRGAPWLTHEWLSEVLLGAAFNLGGWSGVVILTAAMAGLDGLDPGPRTWPVAERASPPNATDLRIHALERQPSGPAAHAGDANPGGLDGGTGSRPSRGSSTAVADAPADDALGQSAWQFLLRSGADRPLRPGSSADLSARATRRSGAAMGRLWSCCCCDGGLTPHGFKTLLFPLSLINMPSLANIGEWAPTDFSVIGPLEIALLAGLFVTFTRPLNMPFIRIALLALLLHLALQHVRYDQMLGVVGALILAQPLAGAYGQTPAPGGRRPVTASIVASVSVALAIAAIAARLAFPVTPQDGPARPVSALAALPPQIASMPVLNDYSFGGYLIGQHIAPFIDGRADMYGDAFLKAYARLLRPDKVALARVLEVRHVGWTLLVPGTPIAHAMDEMPGWRRLRTDRWSVIHVRTSVPQP